MKTPFTGGCLCGAIRYECTATSEQLWMFKCHCRDCQQVSGGAYTPAILVPRTTFRLTRGTLRHHATPSEMGGLHKRGFCPDCGSRITGGEMEGAESERIGIVAGSLDAPSGFQPGVEFWTADAQPWDPLLPGLPAFEKYPEE